MQDPILLHKARQISLKLKSTLLLMDKAYVIVSPIPNTQAYNALLVALVGDGNTVADALDDLLCKLERSQNQA